MSQASVTATASITRAEIVAALAKAVRLGVLQSEAALASRQLFHREWPHLLRLQIMEPLLERATAVAWEHGLRGYDAVHLGAALTWRDALDHPVVMMTFDRRLWEASGLQGLESWPPDLPGLVDLDKPQADPQRR